MQLRWNGLTAVVSGLCRRLVGGGKALQAVYMASVACPFDVRRDVAIELFNSLTAIDGHDSQYFNELRSTVVSRQIFIRSQSLIAR